MSLGDPLKELLAESMSLEVGAAGGSDIASLLKSEIMKLGVLMHTHN